MAKKQHTPAAPAATESPAPAAVPPVASETPLAESAAPSAVGDIKVDVTDDEILAGMSESDLDRLRRLASLAEARKRATPAAATPEDEELVRVYNRSRRRFDHHPYQSFPAAFASVPRWLARKWLADWPADFVAGEDAVKSIDATRGALNEANAKIKELEAQLKAAKEQK